MSRLRVRIELNRGGVGVPLDKLASVVQQSQSFFRMLGDDVHIDQSQGDWLGFDFDHESLNFTAEFVGPVSQEQVAAFHSAFDGTTPLRRATIVQFAHIADAIDQDEVIGFGLYLNEGDDPAEWRCLSRRDALRISEEVQMLLGAGQAGQDSHLPAVADASTSARYMFGRRDRAVESAKLTGAVREVEATLSKRMDRLEGEVANHSGHIQDLRSKSMEAELSMGRLLSAVEGFCEQAANRLESATTPALAAGAAASASRMAPDARPNPEGGPNIEARAAVEAPPKFEAPSKPEALSKAEAAPTPATGSPSAAASPTPVASASSVASQSPAVSPSPVATMLTTAAANPLRAAAPVMTAAPFTETPSTWWRSPIVILVGLGTAVVLIGMLIWPTGSSSGGTSASETTRSEPAPAPPASAPAAPQADVPQPAAPAVAGATRIALEASEPTWVSIRSGDGTGQMSGLVEPGNIRSVDIREPAVLRVGNAGGLTIRANGKLLGPLGPHGAVREVEFKSGDFKVVPIQ